MTVSLDVAATIGALALLVTALTSMLSVIISFRNSRAIEVVRHATNSLKDELVASTKEASTAQGFLEGKKEGRRAQKEDDEDATERARRP